MRELRGRLSGLALPTYALDIPGGHGKSRSAPPISRRAPRAATTSPIPTGTRIATRIAPAPEGGALDAQAPIALRFAVRLQRVNLDRLALAAQRQRPQRALADAGGKRGEALQQRRRGEHAATGFAAGLFDARGGVHRVADQRDLHLEIAEFAHDHRTAMKAGAEIGAEAEFADVAGGAGGEAVEGGKTGAHAAGLVKAGGEPPRADDLVADVFVDLAARLGDGERDVGDEAVEEVHEAQLAEALGDRGGGAHVDEQQRAFLDARVVIASATKANRTPGPSSWLTPNSRLKPRLIPIEKIMSARVMGAISPAALGMSRFTPPSTMKKTPR